MCGALLNANNCLDSRLVLAPLSWLLGGGDSILNLVNCFEYSQNSHMISGYYISNHDSAIYLHSHGMISLACNYLQLNLVGTQNCFPLFRLPRGVAGLSTIITQFTQFRASGQGEEKGNWGRRNALVKRLHIQFKAISPKKETHNFAPPR